MRRVFYVLAVSAMIAVALPRSLPACSLCGSLLKQQTIRAELTQAKLVLYGLMQNPKINTKLYGGTTDFHVKAVVKPLAGFAGKKFIVINKYIPVLNPNDPPKFMVFFDLVNKELDPYHGRPVQSDKILTYIDGMKILKSASNAEALEYYYHFLDFPDEEIASDAFLEFAKASDLDVGKAALKLPADKFRKLLVDPKTPAERLGLFAFLLGAKKNPADAKILRDMINSAIPRNRAAMDGLLCGYIQLEPDAGWKNVYTILTDKKSTFTQRYSAFRVIRFYQNWKPKEFAPQIMHGLKVMLAEKEISDFAIEALRRWGKWELTPSILQLAENKAQTSPIVERAIVRYALCCPLPQAMSYVEKIKKSDPDLLQDVRESLEFEKQLDKTSGS